MKYRPSRKLCVMVSELLLSVWDELFLDSSWDLIVPIPPSLPSLKLRGFNQAAVIGRTLSKQLNLPISLSALLHRGYRAPQASLKPERRLSNVKRAIRARASLVSEKRILLVDDVVTTGATVSVAIRALLDAGAAQVDVVSVARSQNWNSYRNKVQKIFR